MNDSLQIPDYDNRQGKLHIGPLRYLLLRPETFGEIQKGIEDRLGPKSSEYLYTAGSSWASTMLVQLRAALGDAPKEIAQAFCKHATELGWGHWKLVNLEEPDNTLTIQVDTSPFADAYGQSDLPVCHMISGAVAGLAEFLFRMPSACTEQICSAQGSTYCKFSATGHDIAGAEAWSW